MPPSALSALPLRFVPDVPDSEGRVKKFYVRTAEGFDLFTTKDKYLAQHIVRAANMHVALVRSIKVMVDAYGIPDKKNCEAPIIKTARELIGKSESAS